MTYEGSHHQYDVIGESNVVMTTRDGVRLATDIYFPADGGRRADGIFPVILERTPYDKASPRSVTNGKYFARRGYICAIQDVRGRYQSEGDWYPFAEEAPDGYDAVEWLGAQPWSNGKVGTMGGSYCGSDPGAASPVHHDHRGRRVQLLPQLHASKRRPGAAVPDLRLSNGRHQQGGRGRPGPESRPGENISRQRRRDSQSVSVEGRGHYPSPAAVL